MTAYLIDDEGNLYFDPGCDCVMLPTDVERRSWNDAADWINMQRTEDDRVRTAAKFGFGIDPTTTLPDRLRILAESGGVPTNTANDLRLAATKLERLQDQLEAEQQAHDATLKHYDQLYNEP